MSEPRQSQSQGADPFENLLTEAVDAHERGGDDAVDDLLRRHGSRADAVRKALADLARSGLLRAPSAHGLYPQRLGEFLLLERIGSGGMGVVFLAEQQSLKRKVAVKIVRPELLLSDVAHERFRREIETIAQLQHPGIVPVLAVGSEGGIPYFAMAYVAGKSLDDVLTAVHERAPTQLQGSDFAAATGMPGANAGAPAARLFAGSWWEACTRVVRAVAQTMAYVHARGIVHRDLKPSNIVVTPLGETLLLDFGLAHMAQAEKLTRSGAEVGSPAYMSPEQLRGDALDERTDIYSLCVTLHQLLALQAPFAGSSSENLRQNILTGMPTPLPRNRGIPRELAIVVQKGMDLDRDRRYRDMAALAADLDAVLQRRPIAARPLGAGLRTVRWCQRHPAAAAASAVALLFLCLLPLLLWAAQRETSARLDRALSLATADYEDARAAVERMLVEFGYCDLEGIPQVEPLRLSMLRTAVAFYERLLGRRPDDRSLQRDLAVARRVLGTVLFAVGDLPGTAAELQAALAVLDRDDLPRDGGLPMHAVIAHKVLAKAFRDQHRIDDAAQHVERMGALLRRLADERPHEFDTRIQTIEADNLRADLLRLRGRVAEQEACLRAALAAKRLLLRDFPDEPLAAQGLAVQCVHLADLLRDHGPAAEALALYTEGEQLFVTRSFAPSEQPLHERMLADIDENRARLACRAGDLAGAATLLARCEQRRARLRADFPSIPAHRQRQVDAWLGQAALRCCLGGTATVPELAEPVLAAAQDVLTTVPDDPDWQRRAATARGLLVLGLLARHQLAAARALADGLRADGTPPAQPGVALAWSHLAQALPAAERADAVAIADAAIWAAEDAGLLDDFTRAAIDRSGTTVRRPKPGGPVDASTGR